MKKIMFVFMALIAVLTVVAAFAQEDCVDCCDGGPCYGNSSYTPTLDVEECTVRINDRVVKSDVSVLKAYERGEDLELRVEFVSNQMAYDVQVMAFLTGYHRGHKFTDEIFDITPTFDVEPNVAYEKDLALRLPDDFDFDTGDELKIRVVISDKFSGSYVREFNLKVEALRDYVIIQDVILDPASQIKVCAFD